MYKHGFLKVEIPHINLIAGDIENNKNEILRIINNSKAGVIVFPELTLTGYTISDLFYFEKTLKKALNALNYILHNNNYKGIFVVGFPLEIQSAIFNVAAVIKNNEILGIVPKYFLPNTQEFQEKRWFSSGLDATFNRVEIFGKQVPFGNILFREKDKNIIIGVEICQDLWNIKTPSDDLATAGANVILNLSASPALVGKEKIRRNAVLDHSRKQVCAYLYSTSGKYESSSETLFSSHKIIGCIGNLLAETSSVDFENKSIIEDINITMINYQRRQDSNYKESIFKNQFKYQYVDFSLKENDNFSFANKIIQKPFISGNDDDLKNAFDILTAALIKKIISLPANMQKIVLGLSGGLDSAHALIIAHRAFEILKLPLAHLYVVIIPAQGSTKKSMDDALTLAKGLNITPIIIDINDNVENHLNHLDHKKEDVTYENVQARMRTLYLMNLSNKYNAMVLGTGDLSEIALGFMTYNGDQMSMYAINSGIPKTLIQELMKYYAKNKYKNIEDILLKIVEKKISPELLINQDTEEIIGKYLINDFILYHHLYSGLDKEKLVWFVEKAFKIKKEESLEYVTRFLSRFYLQQFKRTTLPDGPKVLNLSLSPRNSYKLPSDVDGNIKPWKRKLSSVYLVALILLLLHIY